MLRLHFLLRFPLILTLLSLARCGNNPTLTEGGMATGGANNAGSGSTSNLGGAPPVATGAGGTTFGFEITGGTGASEQAGAANDVVVAYCGDGLINQDFEKCDDGNAIGGDGCTAACDQIEAYWACPTPGQPCVYTVVCGDGKVGGTETCDDGLDRSLGAPVAGDGCDASCQLEIGYTCPSPGAACRPICGDAIVVGREECDNGVDTTGVPTPGDGCDTNCMLEDGWVCPDGVRCRQTVCGDGIAEGSEQCDDGNALPFDGCTAACKQQPICGTATSPVGACLSTCGDGILLANAGEECDDGNTLSDDGCSASCQLEPGFSCTTVVDDPPDQLDLPVVIRDFQSSTVSPGGHPDFQNNDLGDRCCVNPSSPGIVETRLGLDRKPIYSGADLLATYPVTTGAEAFDQWYRDVANVNQRIDQTLTLIRNASGAYVMNSATDTPWESLGGFFPIDDMGWGNFEDSDPSHNFHFTSELRYWFEYKGGESLSFSGDDDVWVFVNGILAVDIGGIHWPTSGKVVLGNDGHGQTCTETNNGNDNVAGDCTASGNVNFEMVPGSVYEVVVFQAERHTSDSNYWLTLTDFLAGSSVCEPVCGDGILTPDEACDLGTANNTGAHGGCNPDCTLAPYCGDGIVDSDLGEVCDDGVNASLYGGCAPGCVLGPYCGDGTVQAPYEACDDGENLGGYGACAPDCVYGPRCGDGVKDEGYEECDQGELNGSGECLEDCTIYLPK